MIERATGQPYRDVVRRDIFERAAMADSGFLRMDHVNDRVAEGADPIRDEAGAIEGWRRNIYSFPPIGSPDGGAFVTAVDLGLFLRAVIEGRLLSAEMTSAFLTPQVAYRERDGWKQRYGYGPWFRVEPDGSVLFLEKEGINVGVSGVVRHYPARDLTLVILSNLEVGVWDPARRLHDEVVAGTFD
jgi:CubicO group peptidase (beta-lactamase class C family)